MSDNTFHHTFKAMGGEFRLMCYPQKKLIPKDIEQLFLKAENEVIRIENKFTDFKDSPFNEINKQSGVRPVHLDDEIFSLIKKSLEISKMSNGIFDISFATLGHKWRKRKETKRQLDTHEVERLKSLIDYQKIVINEENQTVFLPHKEMKIGLGGIGKGHAVDMAFEYLKKEGLVNFYINGSGDIRVHSEPSAPRKWKIGIKNPFSKDTSKSAGVIQIHEGSVSTSGNYVHKISEDDHHIINPLTGKSSSEIISATVLAEDAITSDTTATILINLSTNEAIKFLDSMELSGVLIRKDGKSYLSRKALEQFGLS